jgi:galactokinase
VQLWRDAGAGDEPTLGAILESAEEAGLRLRDIARARAPGEADDLVARLAQFIAESEEVVPGALSALTRGDVARFGAHVRRSQDLAIHALGNQTPETIDLVERAHALGAPAASAFGAGFGGSVWALVKESDAHSFAAAWRDGYTARFRERTDDARFFVTPAAAPARRIEDLP